MRLPVTSSARQAPYSANDSMAFQSSGRCRARTDWVTVCSSTLVAMAVIHSRNRRYPRCENAPTKCRSRSCQMDQSSVACVMARLLYGAKWDGPPGRFRPGAAAFQYDISDQLLCRSSGKLLSIERSIELPSAIVCAKISSSGEHYTLETSTVSTPQNQADTYDTPTDVARRLNNHPSAPVRWITRGAVLSNGQRLKLQS